MYDLQTFIHVLTEHNGSLTKTAHALSMPIHSLRSKVLENAELQAICANRDIEIADRSRDVVLDLLSDELVPIAAKLATAKWALENLASDAYNKKQTLAVESKTIEELSPAELAARKQALAERLALPKPENHFNSPTLTFEEDILSDPTPRADDE